MPAGIEFRVKIAWQSMNHRCNNPKNKKYKYYGGKGIQVLLTVSELQEIWTRDKAYLLKQPSIDRIDSNGNYTKENCRFIEHQENAQRRWKERSPRASPVLLLAGLETR